MKINIQNRIIHRVTPVATAFIIFAISVFCFPPSVFATGNAISYQDYSEIVSLNGDLNIVTVSLPLESCFYNIVDKTTGTQSIKEEYGAFFECDLQQGVTKFVVSCYPFGKWFGDNASSSYSGPYLDMHDIPGGAEYSVRFNFTYQSNGLLYEPESIQYYEGFLTDGTLNPTHVPCDVNTLQDKAQPFRYNSLVTATGTLPTNTDGFVNKLKISFNKNYAPGYLSLSVNEFKISFTVTSLYLLQQQSGRTNAILTEVEKQLEANGKKIEDVISTQQQTNEKLDNVLSGETLNDHNVNAPGGFNDKVNQQQNQMQNNMADINKVDKPDPNSAIPDVGSYVPAEGTNLLAVVMGGITGFSFVPTYLLIVVGLFVVSFIMFGKKES